MEIADRVNKAKIDVIVNRGHEPKYAYLGHVEMKELLDWANDQTGIKYKAKNGCEFLGLKLIEVDLESHFNVT